MCRYLVILSVGVIIAAVAAARAQEIEPTFLDRKMSAWIDDVQNGKTVKERRRAILVLEQIGYAGSRKIMPPLVQAVREDKDEAVRAAAARAVGRAAAKALEQARADKKDELPRFDNARDALATAVRADKAEKVREAAALALGDLGYDARTAVGSLAAALKDKHKGTVNAAAAALKRIGREASEAQPELQVLLADKKADVEARVDAAVCLGQIRPDVPQALPGLKEALADEKADARIRRAVAEALGKLGKDAADATPALAAALIAKDSPPDLRLAAVGALDQFGAAGKDAIPALVKAVGDPALHKAVGDDVRFLRCLGLHALGRMGDELRGQRKAVVAVVLKAMDDPNVEVCISAVETLGALGADGIGGEMKDVVKQLDALLKREGRKSIREAATATRDKLVPKK